MPTLGYQWYTLPSVTTPRGLQLTGSVDAADSRPGFLSSLFGGSSATQTAPPAAEVHQTDASNTRTASESIPAPSLPPIRTPHDESPISHPELSFTPSDIG